MKSKEIRFSGIALLVILVLFSLDANAQRGGSERGRGSGRHEMTCQTRARNYNWSDQLDLTDDQKSKIDEIKLTSSKTSIQRRNKINELEAQLTTLLSEDAINKSKVNTTIDEIGELKTEDRKAMVEDHMKVRDLLTVKQRIIFDQHNSSRKFRWGRYY